MRIRRRPLPFPPPVPPSSTLTRSDPSTSACSSTQPPNLLLVQTQNAIELDGLHPNGDLLPIHTPSLRNKSLKIDPCISPLTSTTHLQVWKKEKEEEGTIDSGRRADVQVNSDKGIVTYSDEAEAKPKTLDTKYMADGCTPAKEELRGDEVLTRNGKKTRRSPAVLMEGSRCSRVNGRGWRCCQPTLVGYSLCEHHLGKGRLRSMNSYVKGQLGCTDHKRSNTDRGSADEIARKKSKKIGFVKARSISSLLDETSDNHSSDGET